MHEIHHMIVSGRESRMVEDSYRKVPAVSIDTGVMERSDQCSHDSGGISVVGCRQLEQPGRGGSAGQVGNVVTGRVVDWQPELRALCRSAGGGHHRALEDMVVVDTPDATLVCPKTRSQDVKKMVEILKQQGAPEHLEHLTVFGHGVPIRCWRKGRDIRSSG